MLLSFLGTETRGTVAAAVESSRSLSGYGLITAVGLLLGFARELMVASTFGLSPQLDVFVAIMSLQLLFGAQIGNALETAFIAGAAKERTSAAAVSSLKPALYGLLSVNAAVVCLLWIGAEPLLRMIFSRFDDTQQALAIHTLHALLLPMVFASTAGLLRGALAVLGSFAPGFLSGAIVSVCTIVSLAAFSSTLGIDAITLGVAVGNLCVLSLYAWRLAQLGGTEVDAGTVIRRSGWFVLWGAAAMILIGELVYAAVTLVERSFASWLPAGAISGFFYASTIVSVPLSLIVMPLATVTFPSMVETFERDVRAGLALLRNHGLFLLVLSIGVAGLVAIFAQPVVEAVFMRGRFSAEDVRYTASVLALTIFGLPFMSLGRLVRNVCYALSDYRTPVIGLTVQLAALAGLGFLLVPRYGAQGLAIAMVTGEAATMLTMSLLLGVRLRAG